MKKNTKHLITYSCILAIGILFGLAAVAQSQQKSEQGDLDKEWYALMKKNADQDAGQDRSRYQRRGGREGSGRGPGGFDRGGFGGGGRFGQVNPEDLMAFMKEHAPNLEGKLANLRVQDPEQFRRQFYSLSRLFGPVMREMQRNPELGELGLKKITTRLQVEQQVKEIKGGQDTPKARTQLRTTVGKLFDVILAQEGKRVESWMGLRERFQQRGEGEGRPDRRGDSDRAGRFGSDRERSDRRSERFGRESDRPADGDDRYRERIGRRNSSSDRGPERQPEGGDRFGRRPGGPDRGDGRFGRGGFGGGGGFRGGFGRGGGRLDEYQANIEAWEKNRDRIIDNQVDNLLKDIKPFPWGR